MKHLIILTTFFWQLMFFVQAEELQILWTEELPEGELVKMLKFDDHIILGLKSSDSSGYSLVKFDTLGSSDHVWVSGRVLVDMSYGPERESGDLNLMLIDTSRLGDRFFVNTWRTSDLIEVNENWVNSPLKFHKKSIETFELQRLLLTPAGDPAEAIILAYAETINPSNDRPNIGTMYIIVPELRWSPMNVQFPQNNQYINDIHFIGSNKSITIGGNSGLITIYRSKINENGFFQALSLGKYNLNILGKMYSCSDVDIENKTGALVGYSQDTIGQRNHSLYLFDFKHPDTVKVFFESYYGSIEFQQLDLSGDTLYMLFEKNNQQLWLLNWKTGEVDLIFDFTDQFQPLQFKRLGQYFIVVGQENGHNVVKAIGPTDKTSLSENDKWSSIKVWPNPTDGKLRVSGLPSGTIVFLDASGREVVSLDFFENQELDLEIPPGIYIYQIGNFSGRLVIK